MGASVQRQQLNRFKPQISDYQLVYVHNPLNIYRNLYTGQQMMQFKQQLYSTQDIDRKIQTFQARYQHMFLVSTLYMDVNKSQMCTDEFQMKVYYERVITNLSKVNDIPFQDSLHCLVVALKGFQILFKNFGYFQIFENMFHICHRGRLKVWCNQHVFKPVPQEYLLGGGNEADMITRIINIVDANTDHSKPHYPVKQTLFCLPRLTFLNTMAALKQICGENKLTITQRLQSLQNAGQIQNILDIYSPPQNRLPKRDTQFTFFPSKTNDRYSNTPIKRKSSLTNSYIGMNASDRGRSLDGTVSRKSHGFQVTLNQQNNHQFPVFMSKNQPQYMERSSKYQGQPQYMDRSSSPRKSIQASSHIMNSNSQRIPYITGVPQNSSPRLKKKNIMASNKAFPVNFQRQNRIMNAPTQVVYAPNMSPPSRPIIYAQPSNIYVNNNLVTEKSIPSTHTTIPAPAIRVNTVVRNQSANQRAGNHQETVTNRGSHLQVAHAYGPQMNIRNSSPHKMHQNRAFQPQSRGRSLPYTSPYAIAQPIRYAQPESKINQNVSATRPVFNQVAPRAQYLTVPSVQPPLDASQKSFTESKLLFSKMGSSFKDNSLIPQRNFQPSNSQVQPMIKPTIIVQPQIKKEILVQNKYTSYQDTTISSINKQVSQSNMAQNQNFIQKSSNISSQQISGNFVPHQRLPNSYASTQNLQQNFQHISPISVNKHQTHTDKKQSASNQVSQKKNAKYDYRHFGSEMPQYESKVQMLQGFVENKINTQQFLHNQSRAISTVRFQHGYGTDSAVSAFHKDINDLNGKISGKKSAHQQKKSLEIQTSLKITDDHQYFTSPKFMDFIRHQTKKPNMLSNTNQNYNFSKWDKKYSVQDAVIQSRTNTYKEKDSYPYGLGKNITNTDLYKPSLTPTLQNIYQAPQFQSFELSPVKKQMQTKKTAQNKIPVISEMWQQQNFASISNSNGSKGPIAASHIDEDILEDMYNQGLRGFGKHRSK